MTAAALLLVTCGVLFFQDVRLRRGLSEAERNAAALDHRVGELTGQLADQRAANDKAAREIDGLRSAPAVALVLMPQTRAVRNVPVLAVPRGANVVALDLQLEAGESVQYVAALKDAATPRSVWRSGVLTPGPSRRPPAISVVIPARLLTPQHYSLEVSGRTPTGAFEIVGSYAFQIEPR